jgi:glycosyltransferase involved in cell wall biosynthesis
MTRLAAELPAPTAAVPAHDTPARRRVTYISWAESCSRSDHTARELGGSSHMVYAAQFGSRASTILLKYAVQWLRTLQILAREQPDAVFVMTPPVFAALPAFWYGWRTGAQVILDAHTAAFLLPRWRSFQWLQRLLCRRALTTLVSNQHLGDVVRAAGGHATLVPDVPVVFPERDAFPRPDGFVVGVVCSFDYDEPVAEVFAAAAQLPDVTFFVTGNPRKLPPDVRTTMPSNVTLLGFVSTAQYGGLLADADAIVVLTTYDHTMLRGAYEAIYQGTPVVISDWQLLRDAFPEGAVHVDNTANGIAEGIRTVARDPRGFKAAAARMRVRKLEYWESTRRAVLARIEQPRGAAH